VKGKLARKLRKLSNFNPRAERHYHQFDNSHNYVIGSDGNLKRGPGTIIEVTSKGDATTTRARYKFMKRRLYGRTF